MTPTEQTAYNTILAQNKWIEEAKPLLARGGEMEKHLERLIGLYDSSYLQSSKDGHARIEHAIGQARAAVQSK